MNISRQLTRLSLAGMVLGLSLAANARTQADQVSADIRRTSFGVPHIRAANERGLGYGIGYAYAQDNLCLLANEITTVNGERSRYFGPDQLTFEERPNAASDVFFTWLNSPKAVDAFWQAQTPQVRDLIEGYVTGYNRLLKERRVKGLPVQCQGEWVRDITALDLIKLTRRIMVEGGLGPFAEALVGAAPPQAVARVAIEQRTFDLADSRLERFALDRGSNAVAVGSERSFNGRGMLLANPHYPWVGGLRFYQMHLTIPGKLDVMGAALPGLPMINIGFNQHLAWTHTVDSSKHFTVYRLQLDPKDPTRYLLNGQSLPMKRQTVTVDVKQADGKLEAVSRVIYSSAFGPIVQWPGKLDWDNQYAYSVRDANLDNDRLLQQWYAMNQADSLQALQDSVHKIQGIPWVNTLAADAQGQTLYMNLSVVPYVNAQKLAKCTVPPRIPGMAVLDGSSSACAWDSDPAAAQKGIYAANKLPQLLRRDFVQHSNDSAWLVNPAQPLTGFSPLVSLDNRPLGLRARFALDRLEALKKNGKITAKDLERMVMDDQVYQAELVMPDLLKHCSAIVGADASTLAPLCASLKSWDRRANLNSGLGLVHFHNILESVQELPDVWRVGFDPKDPQHTPRGLAVERPEVAKVVREAMLASAVTVEESGLEPGTRWGDIQQFNTGNQQTPIHGGPGTLGIYNAIQSVPKSDGTFDVIGGTSYLQVVTFDDKGPQARGLLAMSLSSDPASKHASDQTLAFSKKQLSVLPFTDQQITADPEYQVVTIREQDETAGKVAGD